MENECESREWGSRFRVEEPCWQRWRTARALYTQKKNFSHSLLPKLLFGLRLPHFNVLFVSLQMCSLLLTSLWFLLPLFFHNKWNIPDSSEIVQTLIQNTLINCIAFLFVQVNVKWSSDQSSRGYISWKKNIFV